MRPLGIDLYCGLGGWTEGLLAEGYDMIGFDIERHVYGGHRYPAQLVIQDVLTLHGRQLKNASLIVASPPCQEYSWMAMPWSRAKQVAAALRDEGEFPDGYKGSRTITDLTALFDACFRIQREACEAASRHIPMVVEIVRGAIPWVGRSRWNFGSFHLWGDVPALMPIAKPAAKVPGMGASWYAPGHPKHVRGLGFNTHADQHIKGTGGSWFGDYASMRDGIKQGGDWFNASQPSISRMSSSKSPARKMASAMIAKIPLPLSRHIARCYLPAEARAAA